MRQIQHNRAQEITMNMAKPCFLKAFLLLLALLSLSFSQGFGRRVQVVQHSHLPFHKDDNSGMGREMMEIVSDYQNPRANTNPRGAPLFNAPAPTFPPIN